MAEPGILLDLAVVLGAAALSGLLLRALRLPLLFGFLVAGVLVGPQSPLVPLVQDEASLQGLADLGVVLLLFVLGLSFNFRQLRRVGAVSLVVMVTQGVLMLWLGYQVSQVIGWSVRDGIFLGAILSVSSTVIAVKAIDDLQRASIESSRITYGVLILQDIAAVLMLVLLASYAATQAGGLPLADVGRILAGMALFLIGTLLVGLLLVPRFLDHVARRQNDEILLLTVLGLGLGYAVLSTLANFHPALGAFLMGALVAESKHVDRVEQLMRPVAQMFTATFFVTMGTLVDFQLVLLFWKPILLLTALVLVGKFVTGAASAFLLGYPPSTVVGVGLALATIGEFSFVIAALGETANVTSDFLFPIVIGVAVLTSLFSPVLVRSEQTVLAWLARLAPEGLRTYVRVYTSWMAQLRVRTGLTREGKRVEATRGAVLSIVLVASVLGGAWLLQGPGRLVLVERGLREPVVSLSYWGLVLALLIPLMFKFYQSVHRWLGAWVEPAGSQRRSKAMRRVVATTFYLLGIAIFGLPVLAAIVPFLGTPVIAVAWIGMVGSGAVILWASINRLHANIEANVQSLLDDHALHASSHQIVRDLLRGDFPLDLKIGALGVRTGSWAAGRRLGEIDLRFATGASVILIERDGTREEIPGPDSILLPGDRVNLIGSPEQIEAARAVLSRPADPMPRKGQLRIGRLFVGEASRLDGLNLSDAALPAKHGLQVLALLREEKAMPNPGRETKLRASDVILVLGTQEQIAAATALTTPPPAGAATPEHA